MTQMRRNLPEKTQHFVDLEERFGAHNYKPLSVVIEKASGAWVTDVEGKRYLDCLGAYSAVNQGHSHPRIVAALVEQAQRVTLTSRAFRNDQLPLFEKELCELLGYERMLPMNSGAEAVETAIKLARRWGYQKKGIPDGQAEIIVCANNFHGRTTTIVSFSSDPLYRDGFGPFTPGFVTVPLGDLAALQAAITPRTCGFLVEPIQAEAGILIPPDGYLAAAAALCKQHNVLLIADEIQTGLGRTGQLLACQHENVRPDVVILGKALSGGVYPVSAVLSSADAMDVFRPGSHGSTFGGNPLACAVARAAIRVLDDEKLCQRAATLGAPLLSRLRQIKSPYIREIRGRGLLVGIELDRPARPFCEALAERGVLCKETHDFVLRIAPPLVVSAEDLDWAVDQFAAVLG
ncbi:MAG TPA: ornithine--oxo-acid transaminase [Pseudomonadota bacterium]|jgi:ornithine--oxo-acid transaminase|nr:ornithine--oxo-acid transaminase [Pseudomonadota bacterium]HNI61406.1 ornithine--oxo-acid transaminase [Pseudomonadota bacterium]HNK43686.1 ornithine--oxo-acid transaminase [Pseudomonadota bacterium]HNN50086.1 ornithine--oxo-acid transaminase [Pseudomonadota bacterium]